MPHDNKFSIVIVGMGALGSHLVQLLRNENLVIHIIDDDRVERKNVLSQFHPASAVGKSKVQSVQQTMNFLFKHPIQVHPVRLSLVNVAALLSPADLVVDCVDNAATRKLIQVYCRGHDIPCLHGALAADGQFGRVVWDEKFEIDSEDGVGAATCEDGEHLAFIAVTAAYLAQALHRWLIDHEWKINFSISPATAFAYQ